MLIQPVVDDASVRRALRRAPAVMQAVMEHKVQQAAVLLRREVRQQLRDNRSMAFTTLLQSIHIQRPFVMTRDVVAGVRYARWVEEGTRPGYRGRPPLRPLAEWLRIRHGLDARQARRRAFGLARYLQQHGTRPAPFFKPAFANKQTALLALLRQGVVEGVRQSLGIQGSPA